MFQASFAIICKICISCWTNPISDPTIPRRRRFFISKLAKSLVIPQLDGRKVAASHMIPELSNKIFSILIEEAGASEDQRTQFCISHSKGCEEFRFMGRLGSGGKFYSGALWRVDCYPEQLTEETKEIIQRTNNKLKDLYQKPCPFCDGSNTKRGGPHEHWHYCDTCNRLFQEDTLNRDAKIEILTRHGYEICNKNPLEIKDHRGSLATGNFVDIVVDFCKNIDNEPMSC